MKRWGSALFPLSLLLVLTGLTFWLRYATELPQTKHDGKLRHDPDYIVTDAILRKIDLTGRLKYTLSATDIRHYPDDESTDMLKPNLVSFSTQEAPGNDECGARAYKQGWREGRFVRQCSHPAFGVRAK